MRRHIAIPALLILVAAAPTTQLSVNCTANTKTIDAYEVFELTFQHANEYADPFADVSIDVKLNSPTGKTISIGGFHYGSLDKPTIRVDGPTTHDWKHPHIHYSFDKPDIWKARFAPGEVGRWNYSWTFRDKAGAAASGSGEFQCARGKNPGFVRQDPANPFLWIFDNGSPYFPIGLQDCMRDADASGSFLDAMYLDGPFRLPRPEGAPPLPAGPEFATGSANRVSGEEYFRRYSEAGFNLFRYSQVNCSPPLTENLDRYLPQEAIMTDELLRMLRKHHMRIMYGIFGYQNVFGDKPDDAEAMAKVKRFVKYSVDRWGSLIDIWDILNEQNVDDRWYKIIAPYLHEIDPYHHPVATSWERPQLDGIDVNTPHWYSHRDETPDKAVMKFAAQWKRFNKPVIISEQGNVAEHDPASRPAGIGGCWDPTSAMRMRIRNWTCLFTQISLIFWNSSNYKDGWYMNIYLGPQERQYVRAMQDFAYALGGGTRPIEVSTPKPDLVRACGLASSRRAAVYLHHFADHATTVKDVSVTLDVPLAGKAYWYNTETGEIYKSADAPAGKQTFESPPFAIDMALLITPDEFPAAAKTPKIEAYNVIWDSPSENSRGSMPLGNGDIAANVWVERSTGDLLMYIAKTDAWGDNVEGSYGLPKVGRVRIKLPLGAGEKFKQELQLREGQIEIRKGETRTLVWIDANNPAIHVDIDSPTPADVQLAIEPYRKTPTADLNADHLFSGLQSRIAWCYRNRAKDGPLKNLTFGAAISGDGLSRADDLTLKSAKPRSGWEITIFSTTSHAESTDAWLAQLDSQVAEMKKLDPHVARRAHLDWWEKFWDRSFIIVTPAKPGPSGPGPSDAQRITQGYILQRFISACAGRGKYPIKFNGSLFTADATIHRIDENKKRITEDVTADYRTWGGDYWLQNTRAMYWPMLAGGDLDEMQPLFQMYFNMLPVNRALVQKYYHHDGAYICETSPFWGGLPYIPPDHAGYYIGHYFTSILELSTMMADYVAYTDDQKFAREKLLPFATDALKFFEQHFPRDASGKILLGPDNAVETYWKVQNPMPDIAGLRYLLQRLSDIDPQQSYFRELLAKIPPLPIGEKDGKKVLLPFESFLADKEIHNSENPELYAIYPFRLYGIGKPDLQLARDTFAARRVKQTGCWYQDPIDAAYLGDAKLAQEDVLKNFTAGAAELRFPAFWTAVNDYPPDQDGGGNGCNALQLMLIQCDGEKIYLLPAWPREWNAVFKLHAPHQTIVEGTVRNGQLVHMVVTPPSRRKDVEVMATQ